jgi:cytochrome P450
MKIVQNTVQNIIESKRDLLAKGTGTEKLLVTKDVLGMMMMARDEATGQGLSDDELQDEVMTIMIAGHETTGVSMAWCLLMLASNPEVQEKARQEILDQLHEDEPLTFENLEKLEYCGCVIKETLRLLPPIPITIRQAVRGDVLPDKTEVPAGTIVTLNIGPMMRRSDIFKDPNSFRPDRFEDQVTETTFQNSFIPFLIGPRMCLGYKFALVELRVLLAVLLRHFRFDVIPGVQTRQKMALTLRPDPPLKLHIAAIL